MKIYHALDENSSLLSKEDKEKMAILKLVDVGRYIKNVGIRDGQFYVIAENDTDEVYLEYRQVMGNIEAAFSKKLDFRMIGQKTAEFQHKKAAVVQRLMEIPK
jgi:hypothetical protein